MLAQVCGKRHKLHFAVLLQLCAKGIHFKPVYVCLTLLCGFQSERAALICSGGVGKEG